ncbi:MAG TPA: four-helix bundle copper-binding protein [Bacteroidia bacterium]|nr:four-helix bundle copper-binding protein [Bacteroidia bacterium]
MHQEHKEIIRQLNDCANECNHCFNACLQEDDVKMMARCIELDRDCADICQLTASMLARNSEHAHHLLKECADICEACAEECAKHKNEHCKSCAEACRKCAEACATHQE